MNNIMNNRYFISNNETIRYEDNGETKYVRFLYDDMPNDPRNFEKDTKMICFHPRSKLGDENKFRDIEDFWESLLEKFAPGYTLREGEEISTNEIKQLLLPHIEILPLWLYDHSGISMSCGTRSYPYNDPWDSGQVGYIYIEKAKVFSMYPNATEENWITLADQLMISEVKVYDQYLTGDCWGYEIFDEDFEEVDGCYGFYGNDFYRNGMSDYLPEVVQAIENNTGVVGIIHAIPRYTYWFEAK